MRKQDRAKRKDLPHMQRAHCVIALTPMLRKLPVFEKLTWRAFSKTLSGSSHASHARTIFSYSLPMNARQRIRVWIRVFLVGLILSGLTAFPLEWELRLLAKWMDADARAGSSELAAWIVRVRDALVDTNPKYPFLAYGTDWLAFAHLVIAVAFIGPLRDPVRNVWIIERGNDRVCDGDSAGVDRGSSTGDSDLLAVD
jgi:hypothetical protein